MRSGIYSNQVHNSDSYKSGTLTWTHVSGKMMRKTNYPCRQLNSAKIKGAALCYLSPIIVNKCSIVSAKCVCSIEDGLQRAWDDVCKTRDNCDKALQGWYFPSMFIFQQNSVREGWIFRILRRCDI